MSEVKKRLYKVAELSVYLSMSPRSIRANYPQWEKRYGVNPVKIDSDLRFDINEINAMLEKTRVCG